jgi:hypothetical protein
MKIISLRKSILVGVFILFLIACQPTQPEIAIQPATLVEEEPEFLLEKITADNFHELDFFASQDIRYPAKFVWSSDSKHIIYSDGLAAWILDAQTLDVMDMITFTSSASSFALSPDSQTVAFSADSKTIDLLRFSEADEGMTIEPGYFIGAVGFSPDGKTLLTTSQEYIEVTLWNISNGSKLKTLTGFETAAPVYSAAFTQDREHIAWISRGRIQSSDIQSGALGLSFDHEDFIVDWAFSHDGKYLATASAGTIQGHFVPEILIWDTISGETRNLMNDDEPYDSVAFCPNTHLVAVGQGSTITIINLDEFDQPAVLNTIGGDTTKLEFSPDGSALFAVSDSGLLTIWRIRGN